ncbi:MAG TPA: hypothetical protein VJN95_07965 [Gemmatimonadales bacterium]|nr:hypothetical protein [Gemmatimonadales bacterium]
MARSIRKTVWQFSVAAGLAASIAVGACNQDSGGGSSANHVDTLFSNAARDGWVDNSGNFSTTTVPLVGDYNKVYYRQVFSFGVAGIPQTAQIVSAKLVLNQGQVFGDPYGKFGSVKVYHVTLGNPLSLVDYLSPPLAGSPGPLTISVDQTLGTRELLVTNWVAADIGNGLVRTEYRLQFSGAEGNQDATNDAAYFTDAETTCCPGATPPRLIVTWF